MSFLKIGDRAAGAIKSGGTTRRAAKMVIVDADHPDIEQLHRLEGDGGAEGGGARHRLEDQPAPPQGHHEGLHQLRRLGRRLLLAGQEPRAQARDQGARARTLVPDNYIKRVIQFAKQGYKDIDFPIYDTDWDCEAYLTVSGQNSNNSVRVTDDFLQARSRPTANGT